MKTPPTRAQILAAEHRRFVKRVRAHEPATRTHVREITKQAAQIMRRLSLTKR